MSYEFEVERTEHNGSIGYEIELDPDQFNALENEPQKFISQLAFVIEHALEADLQELRAADQEIGVRILAMSATYASSEVIDKTVIQLRQYLGPFSDEHGITLKFKFSISGYGEKEPIYVDELGETHQKFFLAAEEIWKFVSEYSEEIHGEPLTGDELVNFAIGAAIDDKDDNVEGSVVAIGCWLGNEMIAANNKLTWGVIIEEDYEELCVLLKTKDQVHYALFPFSAVRKRLQEGVKFDCRALVNALLADVPE